MKRRTRIALAVGALALTPVMGGCLIGSSSHTTYSGRYVSGSDLDRVVPGYTTGDEVLDLLGEPSSRREDDDGSELWRWTYRKTHSSHGHVLLLFSGRSRTETNGAVSVTLRDGVVCTARRE
ncbi:MAG: hypothetical protein ACKVU4_14925 [Phycisphaerales bacterium]